VRSRGGRGAVEGVHTESGSGTGLRAVLEAYLFGLANGLAILIIIDKLLVYTVYCGFYNTMDEDFENELLLGDTA
jgi:hypothetical protein